MVTNTLAPVTPVAAMAWLFAGLGSVVVEVRLAILTTDPLVPPPICTVRVKARGAAATVRLPRFQVTVSCATLREPPPVAETKLTPPGIASLTTSPVASLGPRLSTVKLYVI